MREKEAQAQLLLATLLVLPSMILLLCLQVRPATSCLKGPPGVAAAAVVLIYSIKHRQVKKLNGQYFSA